MGGTSITYLQSGICQLWPLTLVFTFWVLVFLHTHSFIVTCSQAAALQAPVQSAPAGGYVQVRCDRAYESLVCRALPVRGWQGDLSNRPSIGRPGPPLASVFFTGQSKDFLWPREKGGIC